MADTPSLPEGPANVEQLVSALNSMRDTLVQVSLLLQDYRFEADEAERRQVVQEVNDMLRRSRNTPG